MTEQKVREIFAQYSNISDSEKVVSIDDDFSKFSINSVDFIKIIVGIETEFGFEFYDDDLQVDRFKTMHELMDYIMIRTE